jgi:hypothetical protein
MGMLAVSAGTSLFQIKLSNQEDGQDGAKALAEAAAQVMVARLIAAQKLPTPVHLDQTTPLDGSTHELRLTLSAYPGGEGLVTLNPARASALGIPLSVNNIAIPGGPPPAPADGWGGTLVAPNTANIVAEGRYQDRVCRIEVVLHLPKFPYAIASNVRIDGTGLDIFGVSDPTVFNTNGFNIPEADQQPGHVATNDTATASLVLGMGTTVKGEAQSRGTVELQGDAEVGSVRNQADAAPIPDINLAHYDPDNRVGTLLEPPLPPGGFAGGTLTGYHQVESGGSTYQVSGPLDLQSAVVFVEGDIRITGGIQGNGALIATGSVNVSGGNATMTASEAAIIAGGDLTLAGAGAGDRQNFRGMLYTEGNLSAINVNVAGAVAVNNLSGNGSAIAQNATIVQSSQTAAVNVPVTTTVQPIGSLAGGPPTFHANLGGVGNYGFPGSPTDYYTSNLQLPNFDYSNPPPGFIITQTDPHIEIAKPAARPSNWADLGLVLRIDHCTDDGSGPVFTQVGGTDYLDRASATGALYALDPNIAVDSFLDAAELDIWNTKVDQFVADFNNNSAALAGAPAAAPGTPGSQTILSFVRLDLSRFYNSADQIKILSWREL